MEESDPVFTIDAITLEQSNFAESMGGNSSDVIAVHCSAEGVDPGEYYTVELLVPHEGDMISRSQEGIHGRHDGSHLGFKLSTGFSFVDFDPSEDRLAVAIYSGDTEIERAVVDERVQSAWESDKLRELVDRVNDLESQL
jgi:hypothetical protein